MQHFAPYALRHVVKKSCLWNKNEQYVVLLNKATIYRGNYTMKPTIQINDAPNQTPLCPHCEKEIHTINAQKIKASFGVRFVYFCASCKKVLGVSHRKGFWMG
jgi:hypothetical protein